MSFDTAISISSDFLNLNTGLYHFLQILGTPWTCVFKRDKITLEDVSQAKCLEERKILGPSSQTIDLILLHLVGKLLNVLDIMLQTNLEFFWNEKYLTSQNLLTSSLAYAISWFKKTWLSIMFSVVQKFLCCSVSRFFTAKCWRHYSYWPKNELLDVRKPTIQTPAQIFFR